MEKIGEGKHHKVYLREDDWIMKIPKGRSCIFWKQATLSQDFFNRHFHAYIPETFIEKGSKGVPYYVFQKRVSGVTLSEYLQVATFSPEIIKTLRNFTLQAQNIVNQEGKLFDIVGTPNIPKNKGKWEGCTNFIVDENTHELRFIDTITGSKTLLLPESIAHFITKTIPFYKRQKQTMDGLLKALP